MPKFITFHKSLSYALYPQTLLIGHYIYIYMFSRQGFSYSRLTLNLLNSWGCLNPTFLVLKLKVNITAPVLGMQLGKQSSTWAFYLHVKTLNILEGTDFISCTVMAALLKLFWHKKYSLWWEMGMDAIWLRVHRSVQYTETNSQSTKNESS